MRFTYSSPTRPSEVTKGSEDHRLIAVAMDWVSFKKKRDPLKAPEAVRKNAPRPLSAHKLHKISIATRAGGADATIALAWKPAGRSAPTIVPEDYLFPASVTEELVREKWRRERIVLSVVFFYKIILIVCWLSVLLVYAIRPSVPALFTKEASIVLSVCALAFGLRVLFLLEQKTIDPYFGMVRPDTESSDLCVFCSWFPAGLLAVIQP